MRAYTAADQEALLARNLLKDWLGEKFLTEPQYHRMEQDTVCELRRTNIFLRLVLFLFTLIVVAAGVALFFAVFTLGTTSATGGIFLLIFAAVSYAAAEYSVAGARLYRYGIEEALAVCSVGLLCTGIHAAFFSGPPYGPKPMEFLIPAVGALSSLWIWHRFQLAYAFVGAMIFAVWMPQYWTSSPPAQHLIVAALYAAGLGAIHAIRSRKPVSYLDRAYSAAEAFLWLGIYLAVNLQLSSINPIGRWGVFQRNASEFPATFYWTTWALIWCLPPLILVRGLRLKDRFIIAVGTITAVLTLITNKPYLGGQRHSWDPMLLGALLISIALVIRRWLDAGVAGVRHGFTARRLSGKDKGWIDTGSAAFGLASPPSIAGSPDTRFGGGQSGGGGASSDF